MFQCAFLWQVNKSKMRLGLLCLVITVVCLFHINEGKHGIFVLLYDGEVRGVQVRISGIPTWRASWDN